MWLINTFTLKLEHFLRESIPEYGILSHTWGQDEITFSDINNITPEVRRKAGFRKLHDFCHLAKRDGFNWVWVDTCAIDKSSSAELSESINSMYMWYEQARICYVFLSDYDLKHSAVDRRPDGVEALEDCRWFKRGWTLQELLAPKMVNLYDRNWTWFGTKFGMAAQLAVITEIDIEVLKGNRDIHSCVVAERFSWASRRETTREEDIAYCLFGLFSINMPLLYGEGNRAFGRLQVEIMKSSTDHSILLWFGDAYFDGRDQRTGLLADHPCLFTLRRIDVSFKYSSLELKMQPCVGYIPKSFDHLDRLCNFSVTPGCLNMTLPLAILGDMEVLACLNCRIGNLVVCMRLTILKYGDQGHVYYRTSSFSSTVVLVPVSDFEVCIDGVIMKMTSRPNPSVIFSEIYALLTAQVIEGATANSFSRRLQRDDFYAVHVMIKSNQQWNGSQCVRQLHWLRNLSESKWAPRRSAIFKLNVRSCQSRYSFRQLYIIVASDCYDRPACWAITTPTSYWIWYNSPSSEDIENHLGSTSDCISYDTGVGLRNLDIRIRFVPRLTNPPQGPNMAATATTEDHNGRCTGNYVVELGTSRVVEKTASTGDTLTINVFDCDEPHDKTEIER